MIRNYKTLILVIIMLFSMAGCNFKKEDTKESTDNGLNSTKFGNHEEIQKFSDDTENLGDDVPITRALVGKMLVMAYSENVEIDNELIEQYKDLDESKWYYAYAKEAVSQNLLNGDGENFRPNDYLSLQEIQYLIDKIDSTKSIKLNVTDENKSTPVSYALWLDIYEKLIEKLKVNETYGASKFIRADSVILATGKNNSSLGENNIITDEGLFKLNGINVDNLVDKRISYFLKGNEIVAITEVLEDEPTIYNAYISNYDGNDIAIFTGGVERIYKVIDGPSQELTGYLCDLKINNGVATGLSVYTDSFEDKILKNTKGLIEFKEFGEYEISEDFKIYSNVNNELKWKSTSDIHVGTEDITFTIKDNKLSGGIIKNEITPETVRIVLNTTGFKSLKHNSVIISSDNGFTVKSENGTKDYEKGEKITFDNSNFEGSRIFINAKDNGKIRIDSIKRSWANDNSPQYRGTIEIDKEDDGYIIINELSMDEYLYSVVPSEMPSSYGVEASKIQAITARSYAYNQYLESRYDEYGGNMDDSVSSQVYNNIEENSISIESVNETTGQVIMYGDEVVNANFYSTSAGTSANSTDVWTGMNISELGRNTPEYLSFQRFFEDDSYGDLSIEENAKKFFETGDIDAPDKDSPWFRWNVEMGVDELSTSINNNIENRYNVVPHLILTKQEDGTYESVPTTGVGLVKDINVLNRGEGGNIVEIEIEGTESTVRIVTEYNIRFLLKPYQYIAGKNPIELIRKDNSKISNYSLMPSSFFVMDKIFEGDNLKSIKFIGGGNGHGVGLSQNGAHILTLEGLNYDEIIEYYYKGCSVYKKF